MTDTITPASATTNALPPIVSREEWKEARVSLIEKETELGKLMAEVAAIRRRQPMVEITKTYTFDGPEGPVSLLDLFEGRRQLIVYHFMFHPDWDEGCVGCSMMLDHFGHPSHLHARDTSRVVVSRAPLAKLLAHKQRMGWTEPWYSSFGTDFNADFDVTIDGDEEIPATSVFLRDGDRIFQTYRDSDATGDAVMNTFTFLDLTPFGRQEIGEDSPAGWPQTSGPWEWWRHHDRYDGAAAPSSCGCGEGCSCGEAD
ncbi:MAG TPA: DUF899 domain-containing protein [Thermomicrobiales bacterium]|nr:DUF899 domain-containing protein [Thermomicrobiales bacterium]